MQNRAENQQLTNIDQYVAAQALTLLSHTTKENQTASQTLEVPAQVGNQKFWISLENDSSGAWVKSGFGTEVQSSVMAVLVPAEVAASGSFVSGSGRAVLLCHFENQVATLTLTESD
jgi:hypothetical protein